MAKFHGTAIALKYKKPEIFESKIKPQCTPFNFQNDAIRSAIKALRELILSLPECAHLAEVATNFLEKQTPKTCREPFATLIHFDIGINNILQNVKKDGTVHNVFVDFQVYDYRSPAADVFFFLWTSVDQAVLKQNLDHLLHYYHHNLLVTLKAFNINTSVFEYESFKEEIRLESKFEFGHAIVLKFMFTAMEDLEKFEENGFKFEVNKISPESKSIFHFMISECAKRGWLY